MHLFFLALVHRSFGLADVVLFVIMFLHRRVTLTLELTLRTLPNHLIHLSHHNRFWKYLKYPIPGRLSLFDRLTASALS